jgi:hypothetical protein
MLVNMYQWGKEDAYQRLIAEHYNDLPIGSSSKDLQMTTGNLVTRRMLQSIGTRYSDEKTLIVDRFLRRPGP